MGKQIQRQAFFLLRKSEFMQVLIGYYGTKNLEIIHKNVTTLDKFCY